MKKLKGLALKMSKGFTLIELLIVIAIIGILAGVLFSAFTSTQQRAKDSKAYQIAKNMQTAASSCKLGEGAIEGAVAGGNVCSLTGVDSTTWTSLANTNWSWTAAVTNATDDYTFILTSSKGGTKSITCSITVCTKTGF